MSAPLSLWHDQVGPRTAQPALGGDADADVVVVGAGLTGLWTAHYLAEADPSLRITVLEAETAGFGASGRNGGWCSALFPSSPPTLAARSGRDAALAQHRAMRATVDEVLRAATAAGVDARAAKGGTITLARSRPQLARARAEVEHAREWGRGDDDLRLLGADEARGVLAGSGTLGATYSPDCAALHPAHLVAGLADAVVAQGVLLHEHTRVLDLAPGRVRTEHGVMRAERVLRCTEGFTALLPGLRRAVAPVYSLVIATEPLPAAVWEEIGLARRETFSDHRHLIVYGQRTADDRLVFGGRGAPYHLGSRIRPGFDRSTAVFAGLWQALVELFPVVRGHHVTHAWGGPLGIARDWSASVGLDRATGLGWAGGYVGDGLSTTNLAGRTLRDLVLGHDTELTRLPWVGHHSPAWEPEPLRWLGINAGLGVVRVADAEERVTGRPSLVSRVLEPLLG